MNALVGATPSSSAVYRAARRAAGKDNSRTPRSDSTVCHAQLDKRSLHLHSRLGDRCRRLSGLWGASSATSPAKPSPSSEPRCAQNRHSPRSLDIGASPASLTWPARRACWGSAKAAPARGWWTGCRSRQRSSGTRSCSSRSTRPPLRQGGAHRAPGRGRGCSRTPVWSLITSIW